MKKRSIEQIVNEKGLFVEMVLSVEEVVRIDRVAEVRDVRLVVLG